MSNFLLRTDSYKLTHWLQYPPDAEVVYSYLESRGGQFKETVMAGTQYYVQKYFVGNVFDQFDIEQAEYFSREHFGNDYFNRKGWERLLAKHGGTLPLRIKAVPEGTVVPVNNVLMTVENTDPEFPWLTNYVESLLLKLWYPITVATLSREIKKIIYQYLTITGDPSQIDFKLHDFGYRGVSSEESAAIGGAAHLINFLGSDTLQGIELVRNHYFPKSMPGFSVSASEHSTMTSWGREHEAEAFANMLEKYPTGLVSVVSDSYDIINAVENLWGDKLRDQVLTREGVLVIRPDSGDTVPQILQILEILGNRFGTATNEKGYRVLNPKVRIIQGDGNNLPMIRRILDTMKWQGWSADNIVFGMGGALLQQMDRDTQKFAFKCSAIKRAGKWQDVYKTATGKASKKGILFLRQGIDGFETISLDGNKNYMCDSPDVLQKVFENGRIYNETTLELIRKRAAL